MDMSSLICIVLFWGGERVPISKIGLFDTVALSNKIVLVRIM